MKTFRFNAEFGINRYEDADIKATTKEVAERKARRYFGNEAVIYFNREVHADWIEAIIKDNHDLRRRNAELENVLIEVKALMDRT